MQIGATRAQVFAQFLLEHLVAAFACAVGVGGAVGRLLAGLLPVAGLDGFFDGPFFLRLAALTLLAGVASGVGPAIGVARNAQSAPRAVSAAVSLAPLLGSGGSTRAFPVRAAGGAERMIVPIFNAVSPDYFATVGTRILRGRRFAADDAGGRAVIVVNEGLAARLWPDAEALGRCVVVGGLPCVEGVGVSEDRRHVSLTGAHHEVFVPWSQTPRSCLLPAFRAARMHPAEGVRRCLP